MRAGDLGVVLRVAASAYCLGLPFKPTNRGQLSLSFGVILFKIFSYKSPKLRRVAQSDPFGVI